MNHEQLTGLILTDEEANKSLSSKPLKLILSNLAEVIPIRPESEV